MDAVNTPAEGDPTTGPTLVFEAKTQDHSVAEDILGILTGTFLVSVGLHLLHAAGAVTGGTAAFAAYAAGAGALLIVGGSGYLLFTRSRRRV